MIKVLFDQIIVSGTRFLIALFIARIFGPSVYGEYTVYWSLVLLLVSIQTPMIFNSTMHFGEKYTFLRKYFKLYLGRINAFIIVIGGIGLLIAAKFYFEFTLTNSFSILLYSITYLHYEYLRKFIYTYTNINILILLDLIIFVAYTGSLVFVYNSGAGFFNLLMMLGVFQLLVSFIFQPFHYFRNENKTLRTHQTKRYLRLIWSYSKDSTLMSILQYFSGHFFIFVGAYYLTNVDLGLIGAVKTLLGPLIIFFMAIETYLIPRAAHFKKQDRLLIDINLKKNLVVFGTIVTIMLIPFFIFPQFILSIIFGSEYAIGGHLLAGLACSYIFMLFSKILIIYARVYKAYRSIRIASIIYFIISLLSTIPTVKYFGLTGIVIMINIQQALLVIMLFILPKLENSNGKQIT